MRLLTVFLFFYVMLSADDNLTIRLFGDNEELMQILLNETDITQSGLNKQKEEYLKDIADSEKFNGLYLKANSNKNFTKDRTGYDIRLEWNLLDDGYIGSQKDLHKKLLQKEMEYEQDIDKFQDSNLKLALYKIKMINNLIDYIFLKRQERVLFENYQNAHKEYDASLITQSDFYEFEKKYEKIKRMLFYYKSLRLEPYDLRLKSFMQNIEDIDILNKSSLIKQAYEQAHELRAIKNKIEKTYIKDDWKNRFKASLYVENKKYLFLDTDSEMIAGVQAQIPLDFKESGDKSKRIQRQLYQLQAKNLQKIIAQKIESLYHKIDYNKNYIRSLKKEIKLFQKQMRSLHLKQKYPLPKQERIIKLKLKNLNINISKHLQEIWQKRTEILKLLLKLQNISGVRILTQYIKALPSK